MLSVSKPSANRLNLSFSGTLDADQMRIALDKLIEHSDGISGGTMLYRISDFQLPTLGALAVEFRHLPELLSLAGRFEKCAVLSDEAWIRTAAEIEGAIFPSLEIKAFPLSAEEAAEAWLAGTGAGSDEDDAEEAENFPV
ncbi:STAS/SEC14 domain-containing protein [Roseobacter sp.]|uniref:STAS/SEC14 domain-containing protein n=1 Tax=Roseobacter sp. TaxID=1907202 RepID=UPI0025D4C046|nr:STAS/SEC14 domain-containing protein [Roseobacter sp.]